jgi:hypothetical protein
MYVRWKRVARAAECRRVRDESVPEWWRYEADESIPVGRPGRIKRVVDESVPPEQRRPLEKKVCEERWLRVAVLVEAYREGGKARQRTRYLCSIREGSEADPRSAARMWLAVNGKLEALALPSEVRATVLAAVAAVVPRPDPVAVANAEAEHAAFWRRIRAM